MNFVLALQPAPTGLSVLGFDELAPGDQRLFRSVITVDGRRDAELPVDFTNSSLEGHQFKGAEGVRAYAWKGAMVVTSCKLWPWDIEQGRSDLAEGLASGRISFSPSFSDLPASTRNLLEGIIADTMPGVVRPDGGLQAQLSPRASMRLRMGNESVLREVMAPMEDLPLLVPASGDSESPRLEPPGNSMGSFSFRFIYVGLDNAAVQANLNAELSLLISQATSKASARSLEAQSKLFEKITEVHPFFRPLSEVKKGVPLGETAGAAEIHDVLFGRMGQEVSSETSSRAVPESLRWKLFLSIRRQTADGRIGSGHIQIF